MLWVCEWMSWDKLKLSSLTKDTARLEIFLVVSSLIWKENLWLSRWKVNYNKLAHGETEFSSPLLLLAMSCCRVWKSFGRCFRSQDLCSRPSSFVSDQVPSSINPFIRHWEPARFSRSSFDQAHEVHEQSRRRKRDVNYNHYSSHYGPANVIKFNFYAHDR